MANTAFSFSGSVRKFPQPGGWHFVPVRQRYTDFNFAKPKWGLIPVTVTVGAVRWDTSLLPMGDGSLFIALPARVRKAEGLVVGSRLRGSFVVREV